MLYGMPLILELLVLSAVTGITDSERCPMPKPGCGKTFDKNEIGLIGKRIFPKTVLPHVPNTNFTPPIELPRHQTLQCLTVRSKHHRFLFLLATNASQGYVGMSMVSNARLDEIVMRVMF